MWLVNAALRNPYAVYVGMLLTAVLGVVSYLRTPTDILPQIKMPVVVVFTSYRGMPAPDMEKSVTSVLERALTRCDHLEHIESRSMLGIGIIKVFFRPRVDPDVAISQVISLVTSEMQNMPPGMLPPSILKYDASAIPVGNLVLSSRERNDKELLDFADHQVRDALAGIEGLASAPVFGGIFRQVQVYVHPRALESLKLSPMEVARLVNGQSQVIPTGEIRIGPQNYYVGSNSMVEEPRDFKKIPLWADGRKVVYLGDVAEVLDDVRWRTNTVLVDGRRAVYMPLLRQAGASAIDVVDAVKDFLPHLHDRGTIPDDVEVEVAFDQSQYVRDAIANLRLEGVLGAVLASLVVLIFLGNLRSTWIVALSIPLSILAAFLGLYFSGHTLNIMTLGGLALILGRIVDDSIVDVENTVRHLEMGKTPLQAARDSAQEIAVPVLMATITTVAVFLPLAFMTGVGRYLFTPLAVSASLAMAASYLVSRTVSPLYCSKYLRAQHEQERFPRWLFAAGLMVGAVGLGLPVALSLVPELGEEVLIRRVLRWPGWVQQTVVAVGAIGALIVLVGLTYWASPRFERVFQAFTGWYEWVLRGALRRRWAVLAAVVALGVPAGLSFYRTGQELFPEVDASEFTIHLRASGGPRVETTEEQVRHIEQIVREVVPEDDLELILSNVGISSRWSAIYTPNNGPHAAFTRVQLRSGFAGRHTSAVEYVERLRERLHEKFPGDDIFFETGGMLRRILNGGALAPIEVQVRGHNQEFRRQVTRWLDNRVAHLPSVVDTYAPQAMDLPMLQIEVDRVAAIRLKLTQSDVIRNVITALMSSAQIAPNFWIDPSSGNPYYIGVQYPTYLVENVQTLENVPLTRDKQRTNERAPLLKEVAKIERTQGPVEVFHHEIDRVSQVFINVAGNDLARTARDVDRIAQQLPLEYALGMIPADRREDLNNDFEFRKRLDKYLKKSTPAERQAILAQYQIDPNNLRLPRGVRVRVHGEISSMRESFREMAFNLTLAVLLVYLVLAAQFASWRDPLVMIVAAPLGLIGVAFLLYLTGTSLNIQSCMGVLLMVGISVSNSVLVVEFANRRRGEGDDAFTAVVGACRVRLRPIVMTTLATVAGLLPLAIHLHPGDEMNLPLARAMIGGLAASTLLTLFVVPALYLLLTPRTRPRPAE
jgi:multidrug efflux pump subunit AcrB